MRARLASLVLAVVTASSLGAWRASAEPIVQLTSTHWYDKARQLTDYTAITEAFKRIPHESHTYIHIAREVPGVGQPAFDYYSFKDTAYLVSDKRYEAASTVKVMTTVGALTTLRKYGLTGDAHITMKTHDGRYRGRVKSIYKMALAYSSNPGFNRLFFIAGFDNMNTQYMTPEQGLPNMVVQTGYGKAYFRRPLRNSPVIEYREGDKVGTIEPRVGNAPITRCRNRNCVTLFEIEDVLRRVILHEELQPQERFNIHQNDVNYIREIMKKSDCALYFGVKRALGHRIHIFNKVGYVPYRNFMENALVVDEQTGQRYLIGASVPFDGTMKQIGKARRKLSKIVAHALKIVVDQPKTNSVPLQKDAGVQVNVELNCNESLPATCEIYAKAADGTAVEAVEAWAGRQYLGVASPEPFGFKFQHTFKRSGLHVLVFRPRLADKAVGYRAVAVTVRAPESSDAQ